jgi:EcsC protein family
MQRLTVRQPPTPIRSRAARKSLTDYEREQVAAIAAWKSKPVNPIAELWNMAVLQAAKAVTVLIPDVLVRSTIELSYRAAHRLAPPASVARQAGVKDVRELRRAPLEECDRLTDRVSLAARALATAEGAATGAGGVGTTLLDVPLLFGSALRTIIRIGQCYGYPGGEPKDRYFNLGVLTIATAGSVATRLERLDQLQDLEELLVEETQVDMIRSELLSFIFQLEVFEEIPGIGIPSGALLNLSFMKRVDVTSRRIFQERWLKDNGKSQGITPAAESPRVLGVRLSKLVGRAAYSACYYAGFGAALPTFVVVSLTSRFPSRPKAIRAGRAPDSKSSAARRRTRERSQ